MKQKLEYEKIESADDSLRFLKVEPKANLKPLIEFEKKIEPKPILFIQVPIIAHEDFNKFLDQIEQRISNAGWFLLWAESHVEQTEYKIKSFTLKDSQEIELRDLKEQILKTIKGE